MLFLYEANLLRSEQAQAERSDSVPGVTGSGTGDRTCRSRCGNGISTPFCWNFRTIAQLISDCTSRCLRGCSSQIRSRMFHAESPNPLCNTSGAGFVRTSGCSAATSIKERITVSRSDSYDTPHVHVQPDFLVAVRP